MTTSLIDRFRKHYKSVRLAIAATPVVGASLPPVLHLWPPLGTPGIYFATPAAVLIQIAGVIPSVIHTKKAAKIWMVRGIAVALFSLAAYGIFLTSHVKCVKADFCLSVGSDETPLVQKNYNVPYVKPIEILKDAGPTDQTVDEYFTSQSTLIARIELFTAYFLTMVSTNFAVGCFARSTMPAGSSADSNTKSQSEKKRTGKSH